MRTSGTLLPILVVIAGLALLPPSARADTAPRAAAQSGASKTGQPAGNSEEDAGLMEFLGGIGSEDDDWIRYLARIDPTKAASVPPRSTADDGSRPVDPPAGSRKK